MQWLFATRERISTRQPTLPGGFWRPTQQWRIKQRQPDKFCKLLRGIQRMRPSWTTTLGTHLWFVGQLTFRFIADRKMLHAHIVVHGLCLPRMASSVLFVIFQLLDQMHLVCFVLLPKLGSDDHPWSWFFRKKSLWRGCDLNIIIILAVSICPAKQVGILNLSFTFGFDVLIEFLSSFLLYFYSFLVLFLWLLLSLVINKNFRILTWLFFFSLLVGPRIDAYRYVRITPTCVLSMQMM